MRASGPRRAGRFVVAVGTLVALVGLIPAALAAAARHRFGSASPVGGIAPPWAWDRGAITAALRDPLSDAAVADGVIRVCLLVAWAAITVIAVTTALEFVHAVRHRGIPLPAVRGVGWAQPLARSIATGLLVLAPLVTPRASLAEALDAGRITLRTGPARTVSVVSSPVDSSGDAVERDVERDVASAPVVHVVARGESVYSIAAALAAGTPTTTAEVADQILDLNLGRQMPGGQCFTSPAYIEIGWELLIPAALVEEVAAPAAVGEAMTGADRRDADPRDTPARTAASHVVEPGDTLSSIAAAHLGRSTAWPAIWELNAGADMSGGRTFDDPDLILPGWELRLPVVEPPGSGDPADSAHDDASGGTTRAVDQPAAPADSSDDDPSGGHTASTTGEAAGDDATASSDGSVDDSSIRGDMTADDASESSDDGASVAQEPATPASGPPPTVTSSASTPATPAPTAWLDDRSPVAAPAPSVLPTTTAPATPAASDGTPDDGATDLRGVAPAPSSPLRLEHAALAAASILTLVGVRRRGRMRRMAAPSRVPEPPPAVVATERRLRTVEEGERAARVDVGIRAAAHELIGTDAQIWAVFAEPDGAVELALTRSADLPAPWSAVPAAGGRRWVLGAGVPIEDLAGAARQVGAPCVALAQVGVSAGRDVLVDLEACGTLAVEADDADAADVITAIAAGLAAFPAAEGAHLIGVSLAGEALLGHRNGHVADTVSSAFELAATLVGPTIESSRPTFELRSLRTGGDAWAPAVILLLPNDDDPDIDTLLPSGGHGLAVVRRATPRTTGPGGRLARGEDGWTLRAFGSEFAIRPVGLAPDELDEVAELVGHADAEPAAYDVRPAVTQDRSTGVCSEPPINHQIIVRLMGHVDVVDRDGEAATFERSKTVELIAWLATHRERSTRTAARTALWELDVRDATFANVVSEARRGLGRLVPPPDGEEWLARTLTERLELHDGVVTDADLIEQRLARSRSQSAQDAVETLRPAAAMIRDIAFAGTSYLWPDAEGITSNLVLLATSVATELAQHALALGDAELVFWATGRGLVVLPGHEELIGLRMRAHASAGDLAGVRSEWEAYERVIVADPWSDGEPAPKLLEIRRELLA